MDLNAIIAMIPRIVGVATAVQSIINLARSNEDIVAKVMESFPWLAAFLKAVGALIPGVAPQLQQAAAIITVFGSEFNKRAQQTVNIVSPLLGLPDPKLEIDGVPGPLTRAATKAMQQKLPGLVADGFFGNLTKIATDAFLATKTPPTSAPPAPAA